MEKSKTKANRVKSACLSILVGAGIGLGLYAGTAATLTVMNREDNYIREARAFVAESTDANNIISVDITNNDYVLPEYNESTLLTRGRYLSDVLKESDVFYVKFNNKFYTKNADCLAFVYEKDENNNIISQRIIVMKDQDESVTVKNNEFVRFVQTEPFEALRFMDLVVEMPEEQPILYDDETMYVGDLTLKRRF